MKNNFMAKEIIVKVQAPLFSSDWNDDVMVYNEDRSIMGILPLRSRKERKELRKKMKGEPKAYFYAEVRGKGLILTGIAPEQPW